MFVDWTGAGRDALDYALLRAPEYLKPPFRAVKEQGCRFVMIAQGTQAFTIPADRPAIMLIGDDLNEALGPTGFHIKSLRRYLTRCNAVAIVSCGPEPALYEAPCRNAVIRRENVAIIETRPEQEAAWVELVKRCAPNAGLCLARVMGRLH